MPKQRDIAIVGMSVACPGAADPGAFWRNLTGGVDSITTAPPDVIEPVYFGAGDGPDRLYCRRGGFMAPYVVDPVRYGLLPVAVEGADPDQLLSLSLAEAALDDAGVFEKGIPLDRAAVIVGRGAFAGLPQVRGAEIVRVGEEFAALLRQARPGLRPTQVDALKKAYQARFGRYRGDTVTASMPNLIAAGVAGHFDMHGPAYTLDAACASGLVALQQATRLLRTGEIDLAVVGAMHTVQNATFWSAFAMMGALSHRQVIAPFSRDADGLLIGQGAGYLVVKTLDRALADDDRVYAVVKDTAVGSDGGGHSALLTDTAGQQRVMRAAWARAGLDPAEVGYVEAHGTGTPAGDGTEIESLTSVFGGPGVGRRVYVGSVKSNIGHLMPAAGMMGLIKTALALYHRRIPPTLHCEQPLPQLAASRFEPVHETVDWDASGLPLVAGVNAFGFGGIDAHTVLTAYEPVAALERRYRTDRARQLAPVALAAAAATRAGLLTKVDPNGFADQLGSYAGRADDPCRLVVVDPTPSRLARAAAIVRAGRPRLDDDGIWYTEDPGAVPRGPVTRDTRAAQALLFLAGGDADLTALGVPRPVQSYRSLFRLSFSLPLVTELPETPAPFASASGASLPARGFTRTATVATPRRAGTSFEAPLDIDLSQYPYLLDHSPVPQPAGWPHDGDLDPVVPLTMSIELLARVVLDRAPGRHIVRVGPVTAFDLIATTQPFHGVVRGRWLTDDTVSLNVPGHLAMQVTLADRFPEPPLDFVEQVKRDVGAPFMAPMAPAAQYREYSFHRPRYWCCTKNLLFGEHGFHSLLRRAEGMGSLLDYMGQSVGFYPHLHLADNRATLPVRVGEISFYRDVFDQDGTFEAYSVVRQVSDMFVTGDVVYLRDGRCWAVARNWTNQRLGMDTDVWQAVNHPERAVLSDEVAPGVFVYRHAPMNRTSAAFLALRYLNDADKQRFATLPTRAAKDDFLAGRVALRDAVRVGLRGDPGEALAYPIEVRVMYDAAGKPRVVRDDGGELPRRLDISLAHADGLGAAAVARRPVGVDIERIAPRPNGTWELACTESELALLQQTGAADEWGTRFWVAKEAYGKRAGTGLRGAPQRIVVDRVEDTSLFVGDVRVDTMIIDDDHMIGWTAT
jgi:3-oxoacyl-(acyl-carrier-protein) synthase/phosphopantetheinyl transferase